MKKIGLFIDVEYGSGGTFQYNQQILDALIELPKEAYQVVVFYVDASWGDIIPPTVDRIKVSYPPLLKRILKALFGIGLSYPIMRFLFSLTSLRAIQRHQCNLLFFPSQDLAGLFISDNSVNVVHDLMHRYEARFKESSGWGRGPFRDRLFDYMGHYSSIVLVDSSVGKRQFIESYGHSADSVEVLPYIAPRHIIMYDNSKHKEYFESLKLPDRFLFYPAQFWPHKNHQVLLEALLILKNRTPDIHLIFTGPKKFEFSNLYNFCTKNNLLPQVSFLEYVPNEVLGGFYLRARAMVMPTFYGPTNIPPLEAIALGCPVAVSNIYGMPEQLGEAALYFDNTNATEVATSIERLWCDNQLYDKLKDKCHTHFSNWNREHFNLRVKSIVDRHFRKERR